MDECVARLQPLVDKYKDTDNTNRNDLIVTTRSCPGDKKISFFRSAKDLKIFCIKYKQNMRKIYKKYLYVNSNKKVIYFKVTVISRKQ